MRMSDFSNESVLTSGSTKLFHRIFSCITIIMLQIMGCLNTLWLVVMSQWSLFHSIIMEAPENYMARNFRGPSPAELCLHPPGYAWQRANKYTSTVLITSLFCNSFVFLHTHSSFFLFALSLTTYTIPAIFTGGTEKIIWFPFWQNIALLKSVLKRLDGGGMDAKSRWHFEKLK